MKRTIVKTSEAPTAGPYSQAVKAGELLFVSAQMPLYPKDGTLVPGGVEAEARQVLKNLEQVLVAGDSSLKNVVKTTVYLTNLDDFGKVNEIYAEFFRQDPPARACVGVSRLPKSASVAIEAVAIAK